MSSKILLHVAVVTSLLLYISNSDKINGLSQNQHLDILDKKKVSELFGVDPDERRRLSVYHNSRGDSNNDQSSNSKVSNSDSKSGSDGSSGNKWTYHWTNTWETARSGSSDSGNNKIPNSQTSSSSTWHGVQATNRRRLTSDSPKPTSRPTLNPADNLSPNPTSLPTPPSPHPTPIPSTRPTNSPTKDPTPKPTHAYCEDLNFDLGLAIIVSNGCQLDTNQCAAMKELLVDIVERTHNDERVQTIIVPHETGRGDSIIGNRDELLDAIDELTCSTDSESVNFNGALMDTNLILSELGEYKKILMISFCLDPESTQTCNAGSLISKDIEITVLNAGSSATEADQFQCLLNEIRVNENYFEINEISVSSLLRKADEIQDRVCKKHTFSPTALPTPQPSLYPTTSIDKELCEIIGELECTSDALNNDSNSICAEYEAGDCAVYYENIGCNECGEDTFRLNDDYPCVNCQEYTGDECLFCDIGGCTQCNDGYELIESISCGLKYCQREICYPYILLPYNSDIDQWRMVGDDNTHYSYSGSYSWDEGNLYFIRHSGDYIILIEQLFKDSDSDADNTDWYLVIKSIYDSNYDTAIYYKYPISEWGSNNKDPTNTVADTSSSSEWVCVPKAEYSQCKVYTQIFELFDGCTGSSNVFCNGTKSNFPSYIDCSGNSESIASSGSRFERRAGVVYGGALIAMFITFVMC